MKWHRLTLIILITVNGRAALSQDTLSLTLDQTLKIAREHSELARGIVADYKSAVWEFNSIKASLLPQVSLGGTLPDYFRRISPITQPDGTVKLFAQSQLNSDLSLNLEQSILLTGGTVFLSSSLAQYNVINEGYHYWQAEPLRIGFIQPLTLFNATKWNYEQTKLRTKRATKQQVEAFEDLNLQLAQAYFNLYVAAMQLENAQQNVISNDTLYKISTGRYEMGKIAENELLQIELQAIKARNSVAQNELQVTTATKRLRNLLGLTGEVGFNLAPVTSAPIFAVDVDKAIAEARKNRSDVVDFILTENQAEMQLKRAQSDKFANGSVSASFGLNQSGDDLKGAYVDPLNSQRINIGVSVPIVGWGKYRSEVNSSRYHLKSVQEHLAYDQRDFDIQVETAVNEFRQLQAQLLTSAKSDTIAQKRYFVAKNRYLLGKISITDLGLAQSDKDQALIDYVRTLQQYWVAYYRLRRTTLYDFTQNQAITY